MRPWALIQGAFILIFQFFHSKCFDLDVFRILSGIDYFGNTDRAWFTKKKIPGASWFKMYVKTVENNCIKHEWIHEFYHSSILLFAQVNTGANEGIYPETKKYFELFWWFSFTRHIGMFQTRFSQFSHQILMKSMDRAS